MSGNITPEQPRAGGSYLRDAKTGALTLVETTDSAGATAPEAPDARMPMPAPAPTPAPTTKAPAGTTGDQQQEA